jgi:UDP-3-O-[3-hydroxymyristoyl] glucosamine N-acyltransferase
VAAIRVRLAELAERLGLAVEGDASVEISGLASLEDAGPSDLSFIRSPAYAAALANSGAGAVVALIGLDVGGRPALRSSDPSSDFYRAARVLVPEAVPEPGVHPDAVVAPDAKLDASVSVAAGCAIGAGARIGPGSVLHPGVVISDGVRIGANCVIHARCVVTAASTLGDRVILHPGVVIGAEGFGYVGDGQGFLRRVHNLGRVVIEDDVEIGANSTVDRGTLADTWIGRGAKLDNLVQIGHNCRIGERVVIVAQAGVAGSTRIGAGTIVMAQAGIAGHLSVGENAFIGPQSGVHKDVPAGARILGTPQRQDLTFHREMAALGHLPRLLRRVRAIERALGLRSSPKDGG